MLEIIAVVFSILCVILTARQNIWCWPVGIIGILGFLYLFYQEGFYIQMGLQIIFIVQSLYGWYIWKNGDSGIPLKVSIGKTKDVLILFGISFFIPLFIFSDIVKCVELISVLLSLLATWYLIFKRIEAWIIWMFYNIIMFGLMIYQGLYLVAVMEVFLFTISYKAFQSWKKDLIQV